VIVQVVQLLHHRICTKKLVLVSRCRVDSWSRSKLDF